MPKIVTFLLILLLIIIVYQFYFNLEHFDSDKTNLNEQSMSTTNSSNPSNPSNPDDSQIFIIIDTSFCGHCKHFVAPDPNLNNKSMAQTIKDTFQNKVNIIDAGIQAPSNVVVPDTDKLMDKWQVMAVPSCYIVKNGVRKQLEGAVTPANIENFMKSM